LKNFPPPGGRKQRNNRNKEITHNLNTPLSGLRMGSTSEWDERIKPEIWIFVVERMFRLG
jgi:hypothetical protein